MNHTNRTSHRDDRPIALLDRDPTFCPLCRELGPSGQNLCLDCGERLIALGYCSTCEAFWKRPIGAECPKHEVPLDEAPPPAAPLGTPGQRVERWVTVGTYAHPNEANAPRIRLEAEGVVTFLDGERIAGSTPYQVATGGVRLQVPESLASTARVILAQTWTSPEESHDPDSDDDDPWAGLAPDPGARRRSIMKGAILIFLFGPGLVALWNFMAQMRGWNR